MSTIARPLVLENKVSEATCMGLAPDEPYPMRTRKVNVSRTSSGVPRTAAGFALLEIAIVLVVAGLVFSGAARFSSLVANARVKSLEADAKTLTMAVQMYRSRYASLPGDDPSAGARWAHIEAKSGNGDGFLGGSYDAPSPAHPRELPDGQQGESLAFWWHLRLAGFIDGSTTGAAALSQPQHADGGMLGVQTDALGLGGVALCFASLNAKYAEAMDREIDDGRPETGSVRASVASDSGTALGSLAREYQDDVGRRYVVCVRMYGGPGSATQTLSTEGVATDLPSSSSSSAGSNNSGRAQGDVGRALGHGKGNGNANGHSVGGVSGPGWGNRPD